MIKSVALMMGLASAMLVLSGCGKSASKDIAKLTGLLNPAGNDSGAMVGSELRARVAEAARTAEGQAWLTRFSAEANYMQTTCPTSSDSAMPGMTCTTTCKDENGTATTGTDATFVSSSCSFADYTATCKDVEYKLSSGTFTFDVDYENLETSGSTVTGTLPINMNFAMTVSGGEFENNKVECAFGITIDFAKLTDSDTTNDDDFAPTCGTNFSCKVDGAEVSCDDIKAESENSENSCK